MSEPSVCCVMLTRNRPLLRERALKCFDVQTYENKDVVILDTSDGIGHDPHPSNLTIGELRNMALGLTTSSEIIIHFDDDDYSHPNRIAEQVALLQSSGADCVGYSDMLFWDSRRAMIRVDPGKRGPDGVGCLGTVESVGEAWLYTAGNPAFCPGSSMCYWRSAWEKRRFESLPSATKPWAAEDQEWQRGVKLFTVPSAADAIMRCGNQDEKLLKMGGGKEPRMIAVPSTSVVPGQVTWGCNPSLDPRMIARIHGANTSKAYDPALMRASEAQGGQWKRVPEWDDYCREKMT